jgi:hypothetical protein
MREGLYLALLLLLNWFDVRLVESIFLQKIKTDIWIIKQTF